MANGDTRRRLLDALGVLLEPVILLLLKNGVNWNDFAEVAKNRFVDVATRRFGIRGRPTSISRVAILTGLERRVVSRIRSRTEPQQQPRPLCKPSQVLDGWFRDPEFLGDDEHPRDLDIDGGDGTFESLARKYAPSIPHVAMVRQLRSVGAVEDLPDGRVRVLKRAYVPRALSDDHIALWGSVLHDVGTTWEYNLMRDTTRRSRFERRAVNLNVSAKAYAAFQEFLEAEAQAFLERVDDWLSAHQLPEGDAGAARRVRLGAGVYHIGDDAITTGRAT